MKTKTLFTINSFIISAAWLMARAHGAEVDLAGGQVVPTADEQLIQFAAYSREQSVTVVQTILPEYGPSSPNAQPGDIFVRTGPAGTIPHGGNYWGPNKVGDIQFDAIELRKTGQGDSYIVPMHWTTDPGPQLNFYRPLESDIPCQYQGKETTLKQLPTEVKESLRDAAFQSDCQRLGTGHGQYNFLGILKPSNQCIDSLLEPWDAAFKQKGITFMDRGGQSGSFREQFLFFQTANPMSWPVLPGFGAMGDKLPRVNPPLVTANGAQSSQRLELSPMDLDSMRPIQDETWKRFFGFPPPPPPPPLPIGGVAFKSTISGKNLIPDTSGESRSLKERAIKSRPNESSLAWPLK